MARALPVALQPDRTVEGARVVIRGLDGVAELPHPHQRFQVGPAEAQETGVRPAGPSRHVVEGDLADPPALGAHAHEELLQDVEVPRAQVQARERIAAVHPEAARQIANRQAEHVAVHPVQGDAEHSPKGWHVGAAPGEVSRSDQDLGIVTMAPQRLEEDRTVREVSVHGDHKGCVSLGEAGEEGAPVPALGLEDDLGPPAGGHLLGAVHRSPVGHDDLGAEAERPDDLAKGGQEELEVLPLVPGGDDDGEVVSGHLGHCTTPAGGFPPTSCAPWGIRLNSSSTGRPLS